MKDFLIFLKNGASIGGSMSDEDATNLKRAVLQEESGTEEFETAYGTLTLDPTQVEALSIENQREDRQVKGFRKGAQE